MNLLLIRNALVFAPEEIGPKDVLVGGEKILYLGNHLELPPDWPVTVIDASGLRMIPGLIDAHVHIAGAGGEGGPSTRTPEMTLNMMLEGGITTVVGCLGTDGFTRSPVSVLMKCKALQQQGVTALMYTGAYQLPTPTITGDIATDIITINEVIGAGEIALSDHRSSHPSITELIKFASKVRVAGMLGGKSGIINLHMGDAKNPFQPIIDVINQSEIPATQFLPTHCNRNNWIFQDALSYAKVGYVDLTTSSYPYFSDIEIKPSRAIPQLLRNGVPPAHITMTSDACGSLPLFDQAGNLLKIETGLPSSLYREFIDLCIQENFSLSMALPFVTSNVADILKLPTKGRIKPGNDADLLLIDKDYRISYLIARGRIFIKNYEQTFRDDLSTVAS